jgi:hypothetical protein
VAQNNSDTLAGQGGTLGERLGIAAITIVFGIGTKTGAKELRQPIIFRGRKDFLPVEPQGCLSFLILLGEPRFA